MQALVILALIATVVSFIVDRNKTIDGVERGLKMFLGLLPSLLVVIVLVSFMLFFVPASTIAKLLGDKSGFYGIAIAGTIGSIALIPPFIALPLANMLLGKGVSYTVVAVFLTTLMMVGVITSPIEIRFFGIKATLWRNSLSLVAAVLIGLFVGAFMK